MENINDIKNNYKKKWLINSTKNILNSPDGDKNFKNYIIIYWLENIETEEEFIKKYNSFKDLKALIDSTGLFEIVKSLNSNNYKEKFPECIKLYQYIINHDSYLSLSQKSGYTLSSNFLISECYQDSSLIEQIDFYNYFYNSITKIYNSLKSKERYR